MALLGVARAPAIAFTPRTESEEGFVRSGSLPQGVRPVVFSPVCVSGWLSSILRSWSRPTVRRAETIDNCLEMVGERLPAVFVSSGLRGRFRRRMYSKVEAGFATDETLTKPFQPSTAAVAVLLTRDFSPPFRDRNHKLPG